jgi:hypothetical protein
MNRKEFEELKKFWYKTLKDTGFEDAEDSKGQLKKHASSMWAPSRVYNSGLTFLKIDTITKYYSFARSFCTDYENFKKDEKTIWELHVDGISTRNIALKTNQSKSNVQKKITTIRQKMFNFYNLNI